MSIVRLKPAELGQLNPVVVDILKWLRENDKEAGDCFLGSALSVDDDEVHRVLMNLLNEYSRDPNVDLEKIFAKEAPAVWARSVHTLFSSSSPRIIPEDLCEILDSLLVKREEESSNILLSKLTAPALSTLQHHEMDAMKELCSIIRETSMDPEFTALAMAASIMLPPSAKEEERQKAKNVFKTLVMDGSMIFAQRSVDATIKRNKNSSNEKSKDNQDPLRKSLKDFFEWRDPRNVELVDKLFENYHFLDLAHGVQSKYGILPEEFAQEVKDLANQEEKDKSMDWFDSAKVAKTKRFSLLPKINRKKSLKSRGKSYTQVDHIIDEIVETEVTYNETLNALFDVYVTQVHDIAKGRRGKTAQKDLCLNSEGVENVFGERLEKVLEASNDLLTKLDLVALVNAPTKSKIGRCGLIADIFNEHAQVLLKVYGPYISSHMSVVKELKRSVAKAEARHKLKSSGSTRKLLMNSKFSQKVDSFDKLWYEYSKNSPYLKGHTLESILITPVQRVPRYKLLLETLTKKVPKDHPSLESLEEAKLNVMTAARQINEAVKQRMKLESFFGTDVIIDPNNSIVNRDASGNFQALVNSYV